MSEQPHAKFPSNLHSTAHSSGYIKWIAAIFILLIILAFLWPSQKKTVLEEKQELFQENTPKAAAFYTQSRTDNMTPQPNGFIREDDITKANQFRAEEIQLKKVTALLEQAQELMKAGRFTLPEENNAFQTYREILSIEPENLKAKNGIEKIKDYFLYNGSLSTQKGDTKEAQRHLQKLEEIDASSSQYQDLASMIEIFTIQQEVKSLQLQAEKAIQNNAWVLPAGQSAIYYYQQALALDPDNAVTQKGITTISDRLINQAQRAIYNGAYGEARGLLTTASVISPERSEINTLNKILNAEGSSNQKNNLAFGQQTTQTNSSVPASTKQQKNSTTDVSALKTPSKQTSEQEVFDIEYLKKGLQAYYKGDYNTAISLLQPLADKGISRAQFRIAYMHYLGRGFSKNRDQADEIIRTALPAIKKFAQEGRSWAQSDLASLYEDGLVLQKNYLEALFWYRSAAEQGYAGAQTNLGIMYAQGKGVKRNLPIAIQWFKKAAAKGDIAAINNLKALETP